MSRSKKLTPDLLRKYVLFISLTIVIVMSVLMAYIYLLNKSSSDRQIDLLEYHQSVKLNFLGITEALHDFKYTLLSKDISALRSGPDPAHKIIFRLRKEMAEADSKQAEHGEQAFEVLHAKVRQKIDKIIDIWITGTGVDTGAMLARLDGAILDLRKIIRLHTIVHDSEMTHSGTKSESIWMITLFVLLTIAFLGYNVVRSSVTNMSNMMLEHEKVIENLFAVQEQNAHLLEAQNVRLDELVKERTSELVAAQDQLVKQEKLATLGQLTSIVSHELRNPLGTINTSLYTIRERLTDNGLIDSAGLDTPIERAERNIRRCDLIIGELLEYSRNRILHKETIELDKWLRDVGSELAVSKGVQLTFALDSRTSIDIDAERFRRCMINLVSNADEAITAASENGVIRICSRMEQHKAVIEVEDDGCGMNAATQEKIFEPLFSTKTFGVGLGLPIARQIVEQHGGELRVVSEADKGTLMRVVLPC